MLPAVQSQPGGALGQGLPTGGDATLAHLGFARGAPGSLPQPQGPQHLQLNEGLLASQLQASTGPSPAGSVTGTPRTGSLGPPGGPAGLDPSMLGGAPMQPPSNPGALPAGPGAPSARPWSSLDGMQRPPTSSGAVSPSDGILQQSGQQPFLAAGANPAAAGGSIARPPSAGLPPTGAGIGSGHSSLQLSPNGSSLDLSASLDRLPANLLLQQQQMLQQQQQQQHQLSRAQTLPAGLPNGLSPAQQQQLLLQQHLQNQQQQQQQQGLAGLQARSNSLPGVGAPSPQPQNASLANLQAAAQAAQAAQAAAMRHQQFQRTPPQPSPPGLPNLGGQPNVGALPGMQGANQTALYQALLNQNANQLLQQQNQLQQNAALLAGQNNMLQALNLNQLNNLSRAVTAGLNNNQQNQLLQGQLNNLALQQQLNNAAAQGMRPGMAGGINPALAAALLGGNPVQLQAQLQAQQQAQQGLQSAQQQLLLNQALRANGLQAAAGLGQRPPSQLQSEALIAMQRQQAALQAQGVRLPGGGSITPDQLQAMAQLGLLKPPSAPAAPVNGMTPQQQAALLSALQAGNAGAGGVNRGGMLPQQQRPAIPPGLANGAAFLAQARPPQMQMQAQQAQLPSLPQPNAQAILASALGQRPPSAQGGAMPPQRPPAQGGGGLAGLMPARGADAQADPIQTLQDIGKTLAQLNITVENAVNAGLLGGLSASDVKIVAEAHRQEMEASRAPSAAGSTAPEGRLAAALGGVAGTSASAPGSLGNITPPLPASPAASHGSAAAGPVAAPVAVPPRRSASEEAFPLDLDEGSGEGVHRRPVDEAALRAKVEQQAAQFDATQYGFFGPPGASTEGGDEGLLLGELESEGGKSSSSRSGEGGEGSAVGSAAGGPRASGDADADSFHLWNASVLPEELENRLHISEGAVPQQGQQPQGAGQQGGPDSAPAGLAGPAAAVASAAAVAPGAVPGSAGPADLASLWGNAQGDRNDPFGSYLAGLRLGTGF